MPNLFQRGNVWWFSFSVGGKRYRRSTKTADKELAEDIAAKEHWRARRANVHGPETVLTFAEAVLIYIADGKDGRFLTRLVKEWGNVEIRKITPDVIRNAARRLYPGKSTATWNRQVIVPARAVINHAAEGGYCPHIRVRRFPEAKAVRRAGNRQWLKRFTANAETPKLAALARFMFETGTRIGEAVSLTQDDLNLQEGLATFGKTKNGEPHVVWLSPGMVADLANLEKTRKVFGFTSRHAVYPQWWKTVERAGIAELSPHEAGRHGFATELIVRHGVDIPTAAKLGNWKSHRLLSETYAHAENEKKTVLKIFGTGD